MLGPGYRGKRAQLSKEEAKERASELLANWSDDYGPAPAYLADIAEGKHTDWRERKAKLFEIGEYEDKSLSVRREHLQSLAMSFALPVPVLIEHTETPLRLGYMTQVECAGDELFGILALTPEAETLIDSSDAKSLSVSISRDLDKIYEVSIVANPRVASARLFCSDFREATGGEWKSRARELQKEMQARDAEERIGRLIKEGFIAPASKQAALDLFTAANEKGFGEEIIAFIRSCPKQVVMTEIAPGVLSEHCSSEEVEFYKKHFPNISIEEINKRRSG